MDACPHFGPDKDFLGPAPLAQVLLMNHHPTGRYHRAERLHAGDRGLAGQRVAREDVRRTSARKIRADSRAA
jgi:succinate dehydrogenase / fumarate reductase iron-sulfur subunit